MVFYPRVIFSAASRSAQRSLTTRMVAPAVFSRMYASIPRETVESRILNIVKNFEKVDSKAVLNRSPKRKKQKQKQIERPQYLQYFYLILGLSSIQLH